MVPLLKSCAAQSGIKANESDKIVQNGLVSAILKSPDYSHLKMNFPEIVDIALPAEGVFHNLIFVSIRKTYPMQASKVLAESTMHGLWSMGQMMFTK